MKTEEIVVAGISGKLPESQDLDEFCKNLFGGIDMVTEESRRWPSGLYGLPSRTGKIKKLNSFDSEFFGVEECAGHEMDPQLRILLQLTFEAIIDSGENPDKFYGSNTGVFVGVSKNETQEVKTCEADDIDCWTYTGTSRAMLSNQISHAFNFHGPSLTVDTACSSSLQALERALHAMRRGACDSAIVAGVNILLTPEYSLQFHRLNMLSMEGKCAAFSEGGQGYVRSEAAVVIFLQKSSEASRAYATLVHARSNSDGWKAEGITYPDGKAQRKLLDEIYQEAGVSPNDVTYVEAHGTGTRVGDPEELSAITEAFCKDRKTPLLIGSVKSNIGHTEPVSGLCSLAKIILSYQKEMLPGNLHFKAPNPNISSLMDGRIKVVSQNCKWDGGIVGINSFGFGGSNVHVILSPPSQLTRRKENKEKILNSAPLIIPVSGRSLKGVEQTLNLICEKGYNRELAALFHKIGTSNINNYKYRGFAILSSETKQKKRINKLKENDEEIRNGLANQKLIHVEEMGSIPGDKREIWFVFSGMGTQWRGMGRDLMVLDEFKKSIEKCAKVLNPLNFNLLEVLKTEDELMMDNVLYSFVCITAVQIALYDVLTIVGLKPNGIIGHSVGENVAAYADGCSSLEDTILGAYWAGRVFLEAKLPKGKMAAVGLTWAEAKTKCPKDIFPACHNAKDSVSVSGPSDSIKDFVDQLKNEGYFAREIPTSHAFHSPYIFELRETLIETLKNNKIAIKPKPRSLKWKSTSIGEGQWETPLAKTFSVDYWANNLVNPVLFEEAIEHIPANSIVIEIAPHALLQAILKRSAPSSCSIVGLMNRNSGNNCSNFLSALGKIYTEGINPQFAQLYGEIKFPVSVSTPMISPMIRWDDLIDWNVSYFPQNAGTSRERTIEVSLEDEEFLYGYRIEGKLAYPHAGLLVLVWRLFSKMQNLTFGTFGVAFEDVVFHRIPYLPKRNENPDSGLGWKFTVNILEGTGKFEILESNKLTLTGSIRKLLSAEKLPCIRHLSVPLFTPMDQIDVYNELKSRGYSYEGAFRGIKKTDSEPSYGILTWKDNWVTLLDQIFQFAILGEGEKGVFVPKRLRIAKIDPSFIEESRNPETIYLGEPDLSDGLVARYLKNTSTVMSHAVEISGLKFGKRARKRDMVIKPAIEEFTFTPYFDDLNSNRFHLNFESALEVCLDLVVENANFKDGGKKQLKVMEIVQKGIESLTLTIQKLLHSRHLQDDITLMSQTEENNNVESMKNLQKFGIRLRRTKSKFLNFSFKGEKSYHLIIIQDEANFALIEPFLEDHAFVLLQTKFTNHGISVEPAKHLISSCFNLIAHKISEDREFFLYRKKLMKKMPLSSSISADSTLTNRKPDLMKINVQNGNFDWLKTLGTAMVSKSPKITDSHPLVYLVSPTSPNSDTLSLVNSLKASPVDSSLRPIFTLDKLQNNSEGQSTLPHLNLTRIVKNDLSMSLFKKDRNSEGGILWGNFKRNSTCEDRTIPGEFAYVTHLTPGDLSTLRWVEGPPEVKNFKFDPESDKELCKVFYSPINFRDMLLVTGQIRPDKLYRVNGNPSEGILGMEFSGLNSAGDRVMGLVPSHGIATYVVAQKALLWPVPEKWSLEEASTIPVAYATAYYALIVRGELKAGESVLIHCGSGPVGIAAISIALNLNCTVYTTVASSKKKHFLQGFFHKLKDENFGKSRDTSFEQTILEATGGKGVSLILNSLPKDKFFASVRCLGHGGRFLHLGRNESYENSILGMNVFLKNVSFHGISIEALFEDNSGDREQVHNLVNEGIKAGIVKPLPKTTLDSEDSAALEKAFRMIGAGKLFGKFVFKIRDENFSARIIDAIETSCFKPEDGYLIVGGLSAFGIKLTEWLIERGAKIIFIGTKSGNMTGFQEHYIRKWREMDITVEIVRSDPTKLTGALKLVQHVTKVANMGGIFILAPTSRECSGGPNATVETILNRCAIHVKTTQNLDLATRKLCQSLDHFVVITKYCGVGQIPVDEIHQGTFNSSMDRICERRKQAGLEALAIEFAFIGETKCQVQEESLAVVVSSSNGKVESKIHSLDHFLHKTASAPSQSNGFLIKVENTGKKDELNLFETAIHILGLEEKIETDDREDSNIFNEIMENESLAELGINSLTIVELQLKFENEFQLFISKEELSNYSLKKLRAFDEEKFSFSHYEL